MSSLVITTCDAIHDLAIYHLIQCRIIESDQLPNFQPTKCIGKQFPKLFLETIKINQNKWPQIKESEREKKSSGLCE